MARLQEKGVALITAMLIVALATVAAVSASSKHRFQLRIVESALHHNLARRYLRGAEDWAIVILHDDAMNSSDDHHGEAWAQQLPPIPVEGGFVGGRIDELQGLFNINNLVSENGTPVPEQVQVFRRLLSGLKLDPDIANAAIDWLDSNYDTTPSGGAEDSNYLGVDPPYRTANQAMASQTEVRLLRGVDAEVYATLTPFVTALPLGTQLNINTAPQAVIRSITDGLSGQQAKSLVDERDRRGGFDSVDEFLKHDLFAGKEVEPSLLGVRSHYFVVSANAGVGSSEASQRSLIARLPGQEITVMTRSSGQL